MRRLDSKDLSLDVLKAGSTSERRQLACGIRIWHRRRDSRCHLARQCGFTRVDRGAVEVGVDQAHAASWFHDAFHFVNGGEAVGKVEEDSLRARDVEKTVRIGNRAGIADSEFDSGAAGGATGGN